jgi:kynurenine formamidase
MDAPSHMIPGGKKLSEISLERFLGEGILIDARGEKNIDSPLLNEKARGKIVLILTGWSRKFGQNSYYDNFPQVTEGFARKLVEMDVPLLGLDTPSPDLEPYPIHKILLSHEILIIENLTNLEALVGAGPFEVSAFPAKMAADGAPVRVVARF